MKRFAPALILAAGFTTASLAGAQDQGPRRWLAGDHHVHSRYSAGWKASGDGSAPTAIIGGDGFYPITTNAAQAAAHGLSWMVSTDHGGPMHSKINRDQAYPEVLEARKQQQGLILFYGMEFDTPGADHSTLMLPHTPDERDVLFQIESRFNKREPWPSNPSWDTEPRMLEALAFEKTLAAPPVVIANHPSRSAKGLGVYGQDSPAELRGWNDAAPNIAVGMEGAPGHQAEPLKPDGSQNPQGGRGHYENAPTMGGFDQMTARLGGYWDSMLAEGRHWWITATSDSHRHYTEGGHDFWPGEYAKTYVFARKGYGDILDGIRNGRVFVTTGDLISELDVTASAGAAKADIGGTLKVRPGQDVRVTIRLRDPAGRNFGGRSPQVMRVDLIRSEITGGAADPTTDRNPNARVEKRFTAADWRRDGELITISYLLKDVRQSSYIRVRGTGGTELEPSPDPAGEDPWSDLWFYANPIFVTVG